MIMNFILLTTFLWFRTSIQHSVDVRVSPIWLLLLVTASDVTWMKTPEDCNNYLQQHSVNQQSVYN